MIMNYYHLLLPIIIFVLSIQTIKLNDAKAILGDDQINDNDYCKRCRLITNDLLKRRRAGATRDVMFNIFKKICVEYMFYGNEFCEGVVNHEIDIALYIIDNRKNLTGARICAIYLQYKMCEDPNLDNWSVNIPDDKIDDINIKSNSIQRYETNKVHLNLLHLSDMHFDVKYKPGSNSKCTDVLCCRENSGDPIRPEDAAGYWGSYDVCDLPWHTVEEILNRINTTHKDIDMIYYTGDIIGHTSYETSIDSNTEEITRLYRAMKRTFGATPVYPVLGNHEAHPPDFYAPNDVNGNFSTQWLFNLTINEWSTWFPTKDLENTLKTGGFYTLLLKPGYRLIALNNNVGYINNLWLIYDDVDPYGQLQWLVDTLYRSEKNGEHVHLIGHIEPGENVIMKVWMHQYHRILRRFAKTIKAQINGHTHLDEFRLIYNESDSNQVVHYSFVGGSGTTFIGNNPNYRIYNVDPETFKVVDYVQYTFNLTDANMSPKRSPNWYEQYKFLNEYDMNEINEETMRDLFEKLSTNDTLALKYYKNQVRYSDAALSKGCDEDCLKNAVCRINSIEFEDAIKCT